LRRQGRHSESGTYPDLCRRLGFHFAGRSIAKRGVTEAADQNDEHCIFCESHAACQSIYF
jgi:hypothetical protein